MPVYLADLYLPNITAVQAVVPVIPKAEHFIFPKGDPFPGSTPRIHHGSLSVSFHKLFPVNIDLPVLIDLHGLPWKPDDPFDILDGRILPRIELHDIKPLRVMEVIPGTF